MKSLYLLVPIALLFNGCCISFMDDTCVVVQKVPGPTKIVHEECKLKLPSKSKIVGDPISFKKLTFGDFTYYGITKNESINLIINTSNKDEYCEKLENIVTENSK